MKLESKLDYRTMAAVTALDNILSFVMKVDLLSDEQLVWLASRLAELENEEGDGDAKLQSVYAASKEFVRTALEERK